MGILDTAVGLPSANNTSHQLSVSLSESDTRRSGAKRKKKRRNGLAKLNNKTVAQDTAVSDSTFSDTVGSPQLYSAHVNENTSTSASSVLHNSTGNSSALHHGANDNKIDEYTDANHNGLLQKVSQVCSAETAQLGLTLDDEDHDEIPRFSAAMSPRRQTLLRHKKKNEAAASSSYISDLKGGLKSKPEDLSVHTELDMNKKVTLFKYTSSKILVFDHNMNSSKPNNALGRLLGHGEFEIFQLHNGDVTYLLCGASFVYPLLPKIKILRVSFNQFILPLVNPERYWKILINTEESNVMGLLEKTLERIVRYRSLYFGSSEPSEHGKPLDVISEQSPFKEDDIMDDTIDFKKDKQSSHDSNYYNLDVLPPELRKITTNEDSHSLQNSNLIWKTIPDSPPSPPISPSQLMVARDHPSVNYDWNLDKRKPLNSVTSSIAGFNLGGSLRLNMASSQNENLVTDKLPAHSNGQLVAPKPKRIVQQNPPIYNDEHTHSYQPHYQKSNLRNVDERSDESMDSLLDEYESNMTFTKSIAGSRPASRAGSIALASVMRTIQQFHNKPGFKSLEKKGQSTVEEHHGDNEIDVDDDFPTTSLSAYSKRVHGVGTGPQALSARSRRSSRSDLYSQENNWMEPSRIPKSRSNYTINADQPALYRAVGNRRPESHVDGVSALERQVLSVSPAMRKSTSMRSVRVNTADVYRMVHQRTNLDPTISDARNTDYNKDGAKAGTGSRGLSRFFGW